MNKETEPHANKPTDPDWKPQPQKRKKKRCDSTKEIEDAIDESKRHAAKILMESEILDKFADVLRDYPRWLGHGDAKVLTITEYRALAERMRNKSVKILTVKCKKLSKALAEIRTIPLLTVTVRADVEPDTSVQLS